MARNEIEGDGLAENQDTHGVTLSFARRRFYFDPTFLGFCLVEAFLTSLDMFSGRYPTVAAALQEPAWLESLFLVTLFAAVALTSARIAPLGAHRHIPPVATALAFSGSALYMALLAAPGLGDVIPTGALACLICVCMAVYSTGYVLLCMGWIELFARMDLSHVVTYFALAHLCAAAVAYAVSFIGPAWLAAPCIAAMPLVCAALYRRGLSHAQSAPFMQGEQAVSGWSFPTRPILLLTTFTFANSFVRDFLPASDVNMTLLGVMAAALFAILTEWLPRNPDTRFLYSLCLPIIIVASFCGLVPLPGAELAGSLLSNAAYTLFTVFAMVLLSSMCFRYGVEPLWLFGFAQAAINLGSLLYEVLADTVDLSALDQTGLTVAVGAVVLAFACLYILVPGGDMAESWGIRSTAGGEAASAPPDTLEDRCSRLARQYGLTRREEEILVLLAKGEPFARIEEALAISNSTLKTHARHIYAKLGVSGRHEIAQLLEA